MFVWSDGQSFSKSQSFLLPCTSYLFWSSVTSLLLHRMNQVMPKYLADYIAQTFLSKNRVAGQAAMFYSYGFFIFQQKYLAFLAVLT